MNIPFIEDWARNTTPDHKLYDFLKGWTFDELKAVKYSYLDFYNIRRINENRSECIRSEKVTQFLKNDDYLATLNLDKYTLDECYHGERTLCYACPYTTARVYIHRTKMVRSPFTDEMIPLTLCRRCMNGFIYSDFIYHEYIKPPAKPIIVDGTEGLGSCAKYVRADYIDKEGKPYSLHIFERYGEISVLRPIFDIRPSANMIINAVNAGLKWNFQSIGELRDIWDLERQREIEAACKIQRWWDNLYYNPKSKVCQKVLNRQYDAYMQGLDEIARK